MIEAVPPALSTQQLTDNKLPSSPSQTMADKGTITMGPLRHGKAAPVDPFTGECDELLWEDWLPTLERAVTWNGWSEEEKLLQLAGYLKGKVLQE